MENIRLTNTDRKILNSYMPVVQGLAEYLSDCYEVVLHSLEDLDRSVICIVNGEHTGRKVGAPITDLALNMLKEINEGKEDNIVYFSSNKRNEPLKSTTIAVRGENDRIIGLICINMYLNVPLNDFLGSLTNSNHRHSGHLPEDFAASTEDLIQTTLEHEIQQVMEDNAILPSNKNKAIVERLYQSGIFKLKDAVTIAAKRLGVSKNTIYMHIRNYKRR